MHRFLVFANGAQLRQRSALALYGKDDGDYRAVRSRIGHLMWIFVLDGTRWVRLPDSGWVKAPATDDAVLQALAVKPPRRVPIGWKCWIRLTDEQLRARQIRMVAGMDHRMGCRHEDVWLDDCPDWASHWRTESGVEPYRVMALFYVDP